ncbi:MAG: DUF479 domain-containing protein [Flavobacteriaceae bacterium]|nr:DUF479 domain-containing protein [Flavobacteriaceae bacterium]
MNFLAHIYLSGNNDDVAIGNFISDSVRGIKYKKFPVEIQKGILLHREIDTFTDAHPFFRQSTKRLHKKYSHYSGVIVDIYYDHFLAKNWTEYCEIPLENYTLHFYKILKKKSDILPEKVQRLMPYMISGNWLLSYASIEGIKKVLEGMSKRTKYESKMDLAVHDLMEYYTEFETEFTLFFDELIKFSNGKLEEINNKL